MLKILFEGCRRCLDQEEVNGFSRWVFGLLAHLTISGGCAGKMPRETLQTLLYFWNKKPQIVFSFRATLDLLQ